MKKINVTIKLYPILHDHYSRQINNIPRPNWNFSAQFMLVNAADYTSMTTELL